MDPSILEFRHAHWCKGVSVSGPLCHVQIMKTQTSSLIRVFFFFFFLIYSTVCIDLKFAYKGPIAPDTHKYVFLCRNKKHILWLPTLIWCYGTLISESSLGPVVQSIISLKSSLVVKMLTVLVSTISNSQIFLLKNVSSFCKCKMQKLLTFFQQK